MMKKNGMMKYMTINLKRIRMKKNISRKELSEMTGIPKKTIEAYESGARSFNGASVLTAYKIAKALNVEIVELIDMDN